MVSIDYSVRPAIEYTSDKRVDLSAQNTKDKLGT